MTYWVSPEDHDKVEFVFVPQFRRPNQRSWERYDEDSGEWKPIHWTSVLEILRQIVDEQLKVSGRPDSFYRLQFYGRLSNSCSKQLRPWIMRRIMTLPPDHNP